MPVFVNRMLNMKQIKCIGFDMDYTLVRYHIAEFEKLTHQYAAKWLVEHSGYPAAVADLEFEADRAIVGLVIDRRNGNLLKLNRYSKVKKAFHGLREIDFRNVKDIYQNMAVDLRDADFVPLDTSFAISTGVLFSQLVDLKSRGIEMPGYPDIARQAIEAVDMVHRNGSIKAVITADFDRFVVKDPKVAWTLERLKDYGKKLMIITNSDFWYTRLLLEHALDPHWRNHKSWTEVFDLVITFADKPQFFERPGRFLSIDPATGTMKNHEGSVSTGIYQGGWFKKLQSDLGLQGSEILYLGDHIYGDVVSIKRRCDWRTALVLGDLEQEMQGIRESKGIHDRIEELMHRKSDLEHLINRMDLDRYEGRPTDKARLDSLFDETDGINAEISELLGQYNGFFNPWWGELLRSGQEESRYADQIDKYACIYMTKVSDLYEFSPKTYFRPFRRVMPHEESAVAEGIVPDDGQLGLLGEAGPASGPRKK